MLSNDSRIGDHELLLAAFVASGGALLTEASQRFSRHATPLDFSGDSSALGLTRGTDDYSNALAELEVQGFTLLPWLLPHALTSELESLLHSSSGVFVGDLIPKPQGRLAPLTSEDLVTPRAEKFSIDPSQLVESKIIRDLALDPGLLSLAQDYLNAPPKLDILSSWFSFPVGRSSDAAATEFHFDLDRTKWLKVFFFLSDVDTETGAHIFVPTTHKDGGIPRHVLDRGYARVDDEDVERFFPRSQWASIGGPRGTILLEDTRGLHKGQPLVRGYRLLLQFQYSQNLFGSPSSLSRFSRSALPLCENLTSDVLDGVLEAFLKD